MDKIILIVLVSLSTTLSAQNEISEEYRYVIGDTIFYDKYKVTDISSGDSGVDVTWDFSNLELTELESTYLVTSDPDALTGLEASARNEISPRSNVAVKSFNNEGINDFILFYYQDENGVESYGNYFIPFPQVTKRSNPNIPYSFPMPLFTEITNEYTDSIFHEDTVLGGWKFSTARERKNDVLFDGIGTVITDDGIYSNCLRIKRTLGFVTIHFYIQNKISNRIVEIREYDDSNIVPDICFGSGGIKSTTSNEEVQNNYKALVHLSNDGLVSINAEPKVYNYFILDSSGKQISKGSLNQMEKNEKHDILKNIATPFGIYHIVLVDIKTGYFSTSSLLIP